MGYVMAAFGMGFIVGPGIGGLLASQFGPHIPFLFAAGAAFATVVLTWFALEETLSKSEQARNRDSKRARMNPALLVRNVPLLAVMSVSFVSRFGFGLLIGTFALFAEKVLFAGYDFAAVSLGVGLLLMVVGVGQFVTQILLLPAALKRYSDPLIVLLGAGARTVAMFLLAIATEPVLGAASMVFFAIGSGLLLPPLQSLVTKTVAVEMRGAVLGLYHSVMSLGVILSTAVSGTLFALDPTVPNWLGGLLYCTALVPAAFLWQWARSNPGEKGVGWAVSA